MSKMQSTVVTIRFFGDDLRPEELTQRLGKMPTRAHAKGDELRSKSGTRIARTGLWNLTLEGDAPDDFETLLTQLLDQLSSDCSIWLNLSERYAGNLFIGLFMGSSNAGFEISCNVVESIAQRGLALHFDIYDPEDASVR